MVKMWFNDAYCCASVHHSGQQIKTDFFLAAYILNFPLHNKRYKVVNSNCMFIFRECKNLLPPNLFNTAFNTVLHCKTKK